MDKKVLLAVIITAVIAGSAGFYFGDSRGKNSAVNLKNFRGGYSINSRGDAGNQNGGFSGGEIIKKDDTSITVKTRDGGSQIVFFSTAAKILKSAAGSAADLAIGSQVMITGSKNQDGSITAQSIQIRPSMSQGNNQ